MKGDNARMGDAGSSGRPEAKVKVGPYELLTILGATEPRLSERLKRALDQQLAKPEYNDLPPLRAWCLALRFLVANRPGAFDPDNRDDRAVLKLAPVVIGEDGTRLPPGELLNRVEPQNFSILTKQKADHTIIELTVWDKDEKLVSRYIVNHRKD